MNARRLLVLLVFAPLLIALQPAPATAQPCLVGCVSSASCAGSGAKTCFTDCSWDDRREQMVCGCGDQRCRPGPVVFAPEALDTPYHGPGLLVALEGGFAVVDCQNNLYGIVFPEVRTVGVREDLAEIRLRAGAAS